MLAMLSSHPSHPGAFELDDVQHHDEREASISLAGTLHGPNAHE